MTQIFEWLARTAAKLLPPAATAQSLFATAAVAEATVPPAAATPMSTDEVWATLANLSIGTVVAWILVIVAIIGTIGVATVKLYKVFQKYHQLKEENERQKQMLVMHEEQLDGIQNTVNAIHKSLDQQEDIDFKVLRHILIRTCEDALVSGYISEGKLRSTEEMYAEYSQTFHGNGYVQGLMERVRKLVTLDGNGNRVDLEKRKDTNNSDPK